MPQQIALVAPKMPVIAYDVDEAAIAEKRKAYAALSADTPAGYELVRLAIAEVRTTRVNVEKRRVALKADALQYGRDVDAKARHITALLESIENPLLEKKKVIDDAKAEEKAKVERERVAALEAEIRANREREEAEERARKAEEARKMEAQRVELAAQAEANRKAREENEREAARIREERERAEAEANHRNEALMADVRRQQAEVESRRKAIEDQERAVAVAAARKEAEAAAAKRAKALRPDVDKLEAFALEVQSVQHPEVKSKEAARILATVQVRLVEIGAFITQEIRGLNNVGQ